MSNSLPLDIELQPSVDSSQRHSAVISYTIVDGQSVVISRYSDPTWIGEPIGALSGSPVSERSIDFKDYGLFESTARSCLYAFQRHPLRMAKQPRFATLIKKHQALSKLPRFMEREGIGPEELTRTHMLRFLKEQVQAAQHLETAVSVIGTIKGIAEYFARALLSFDCKYPFSLRHGAKIIAKRLWREVHGADFDEARSGSAPFDAVEFSVVVRSSNNYIEQLGPEILVGMRGCMDMFEAYPEYRAAKNPSAEMKCYRAQMALLREIRWTPVDGLANWPPRTFLDVRKHSRILAGAVAVSLGCATGARSSEINSIQLGAVTTHKDGESILNLTRYKYEDANDGELVQLPIDSDTRKAIELLAAVGLESLRDEPSNKDAQLCQLFMQAKSAHGTQRKRMSRAGLARLVGEFGKQVIPGLDSELSLPRIRKTMAHVLTLSLDGASLVLQTIFGHRSYQTTVGYMFSSPLMLDAIVEEFPHIAAQNLKKVYGDRDNLMGGAASAVRDAIYGPGVQRSSMSAEPEIRISEDEFVKLGMELMRNGQMSMSLLGAGKYCLKPASVSGPCSPSNSRVQDVGHCRPSCSHHLIEGSHRPAMERTVKWLDLKISDPKLSDCSREFYMKNMKMLTNVLTDSK